MVKVSDNQDEFALKAVFGNEILPVSDGGFSAQVVQRIRRNIWQRRLTLVFAALLGFSLAWPMLSQLMLSASATALDFIAQAEDSEVLGQFGVLLTMLPVREIARAATAELAGTGAQISTLVWIEQNLVLVGACVLALGSLVFTHMLED